MANSGQRFLVIYSGVLTAILAAIVLVGAASPAKVVNFDEITVHRLNVVEPDGKLRMVISNHARLPGIIVRGKEHSFSRPQAGMLFYNDEGSENGGLIFGGRKNGKGEVVDSGGSLTFDKYDANQIVQLAGVDDSEDKFAGLSVADSVPNGKTNSRIWVGCGKDGAATLALKDANGRKRIVMEVSDKSDAGISFLDAGGKVIDQVIPGKKQ
jgi:hypothetical protein